MQAQHLKLHILTHRRRHGGIDETHDRHRGGTAMIGEDMLDARAQRVNEAQARERGKRTRRRQPHQRDLDRGGIAQVRPAAELEFGEMTLQLRFPGDEGKDGGKKRGAHAHAALTDSSAKAAAMSARV